MITVKAGISLSFLATALLIGFTLNTAAQEPDQSHMPHWSATRQAKKMSKKQVKMLDLSADQSIRMKAANLETARQIDKLRAKDSLNKKQQMEQYKALIDERNAQYKSILNTDQYKKWNDWQIKRRQKTKSYRDHRRQVINRQKDSIVTN